MKDLLLIHNHILMSGLIYFPQKNLLHMHTAVDMKLLKNKAYVTQMIDQSKNVF